MSKKYQHLALEERTLIQTQLQQGLRPSRIAESLGRSRSCITRELSRNGRRAPPEVCPVGCPPIAGGYSSSRAEQRANKLASIPRVNRKLVVGNALWGKVSSVSTPSQNFEPSFSAIHIPSNSLRPSRLMPRGEEDRFVNDAVILSHFGHDTIQIDPRMLWGRKWGTIC